MAVEREMGETNVNIDFLGTVVRDTATATNQEFARVYSQMNSLKSEISALREPSRGEGRLHPQRGRHVA